MSAQQGTGTNTYVEVVPLTLHIGAEIRGVDLSKPLHITCKVNGEVTQDDTTDSMIFKFPDLLSYVSTFMTFPRRGIGLSGVSTSCTGGPR